MNTNVMIEAVCEEIKQNLTAFCEQEDFEALTPEAAERMSEGMGHALAAGGVAGFRAFLLEYEQEGDTLEREGRLMRFKTTSPKRFMTPFGEMVLARKVYQADRGGPCFVALDACWGMQGEFATVRVREAVLYSCGLVTPTETETMLKKCALFHPSSTAIKHIVDEVGDFVEAHADEVRAHLHCQEQAPEDVRVLAASLDGANVLLWERGVKRGRPAERPGKRPGKEQPTAYKNAMVGSVSFYGPVPEGHKGPARLQSRYVARMPEERAPTFKEHFEAEVAHAQQQVAADVTNVLVLDGARGLWKYVEERPCFTGYEKIIDFFHATEHLSAAAEALFGKQSPQAEKWYEKYRAKLLREDLAPQAILRSIDYYLETLSLSKSRRQDALTQRTFFVRNNRRMTYADFRRRGLPIGSGVVEAACKSLVKARLCRSGMRWTRKGGQHILHLRAHIKSRRWDMFWEAYKQLARAG
jgi:hypothetical protein